MSSVGSAWSRVGVVGGVLCALWIAPSAVAGKGGSGLSKEELGALARGELVTRPTEESRGSVELIGGTSWQVIDAKPEVVWRALLDTRYYHRMLPRVVEARLEHEAGNHRNVYLRHGVGFVEASYNLRVRLDPKDQDIQFKLDESKPHTLSAAWGFYTVRPYGRGRTLLTYGVMADLGDGLLRSVVRGTVHDWMLKVPWMVKRFVEGSGKWIYKTAPDGSVQDLEVETARVGVADEAVESVHE